MFGKEWILGVVLMFVSKAGQWSFVKWMVGESSKKAQHVRPARQTNLVPHHN